MHVLQILKWWEKRGLSKVVKSKVDWDANETTLQTLLEIKCHWLTKKFQE